MSDITRYPKPNMTNLPRDIGSQIFSEIKHSPKPDRKKMHEEAVRLEKATIAERNKNKDE